METQLKVTTTIAGVNLSSEFACLPGVVKNNLLEIMREKTVFCKILGLLADIEEKGIKALSAN
eukprot:4550668-Ditylum_brightwellii.AAC.1